MITIIKITMPHDPHRLFFTPAERCGARVVPAGKPVGKMVSVLKPCFVAMVVM
jgi:hypothetical protein